MNKMLNSVESKIIFVLKVFFSHSFSIIESDGGLLMVFSILSGKKLSLLFVGSISSAH